MANIKIRSKTKQHIDQVNEWLKLLAGIGNIARGAVRMGFGAFMDLKTSKE